jgi:hypothetical protein
VSFTLSIQDREGVMTVADMRALFEASVRNTAALSRHLQLGIVEKGGVFSHYSHETTDIAWCGFALGLRCAERIALAAGVFPCKLAIPPLPCGSKPGSVPAPIEVDEALPAGCFPKDVEGGQG